jgi:hypothetical protein
MTTENPRHDRWAEWKNLFLLHAPAGVRATGATLKALLLIASGILFVRLAFYPLVLSLLVMLPFVDGPKAAVLVSIVAGLTAVFVGVCVCVYRYLDNR